MKKFVRQLILGFLCWTAMCGTIGLIIGSLLFEEISRVEFVIRFITYYGIITGMLAGVGVICFIMAFIMIVIASRGHPIKYMIAAEKKENKDLVQEALDEAMKKEEKEKIIKILNIRRKFMKLKAEELNNEFADYLKLSLNVNKDNSTTT